MNFSFPSMQAKNRKSIEIGLALKKVEENQFFHAIPHVNYLCIFIEIELTRTSGINLLFAN